MLCTTQAAVIPVVFLAGIQFFRAISILKQWIPAEKRTGMTKKFKETAIVQSSLTI